MAMYNTKLNYNGEPCTWRHVSTVRGQALGNLPQKCGKALGAYPTVHSACAYPSLQLCGRANQQCGQELPAFLCRGMFGRGHHRPCLYHLFRYGGFSASGRS